QKGRVRLAGGTSVDQESRDVGALKQAGADGALLQAGIQLANARAHLRRRPNPVVYVVQVRARPLDPALTKRKGASTRTERRPSSACSPEGTGGRRAAKTSARSGKPMEH